jgi:hypothetical protein
MEKGMYTYDYIDDNKVVIRLSNDKDLECDTFDNIDDIVSQMKKENTEIVYTYDFDDWVNEMLNQSDYSEFELMCFEEHYQNLLDYEQNTENFIKYHLVHYDKDTLMNTESGVLYDKITNKIVGIHNT